MADRYEHIRFFDEAAWTSADLAQCLSPTDRQPQASAREDPAPEFFNWLFAQIGVDAATYRSAALVRRTAACLRRLRCQDLASAQSLLSARPDLVGDALDAVLIGVTGFYRDPSVFRQLEDLIWSRTLMGRSALRVWCPACAHGAELYTMAMVLDDTGLLEGSLLLGSDCRRSAIDRARRGRYRSDEISGVEPGFRQRYFRATGDQWQIDERLRRACHWHVHDVLSDPPWQSDECDLVLCRNVAIYLAPAAARRLWQTVVEVLQPGAILMVGKTERPDRAQALTRFGPGLYTKCLSRRYDSSGSSSWRCNS